jgi:hypothetical protein
VNIEHGYEFQQAPLTQIDTADAAAAFAQAVKRMPSGKPSQRAHRTRRPGLDPAGPDTWQLVDRPPVVHRTQQHGHTSVHGTPSPTPT